jgi:peptidoglycan/xylan/chitin deacetylase (PgdA/CDA1 family)
MILEYHEIGSKEARWTRTPDNFRKALKRLYDLGYRSVSLRDYVSGSIDIPAGFSPVVITFDDSTSGQFRYVNGHNGIKVDPDCAVGILEEFYKQHPDFGLEATFYVIYPVPFKQTEYIKKKLERIVSDGMDIGNHTYNHDSLRSLSADEAQRELALSVKEARKYINGVKVDTVALPYGLGPKDPAVLKSGSFDGTFYTNIAALLVGANPAKSPAVKGFDPFRLPRIQAVDPSIEDWGKDMWINYFKKHPGSRYISDGDPDTITVPKSNEMEIDKTGLQVKKLRTY